MIDETEFSELVLTWDVHEQANVIGRPRVKRICDWFVARGGTIDSMELPKCDYHIGGGYNKKKKVFLPGRFRDKSINLAIEYKTFEDYNNSKEDLNWKLFEAGKIFDTIALFIQENNFNLSFTDKGTFVRMPQVPDGKADITNYYGYKNQLDTFASDGVHVRTFQNELFFEEDVYSLLIHIAKDCHTGLHIKGKDKKTQFLNSLCKLDGIGGVKAHKIISVVPNLAMLIEYVCYTDNRVLEKLIGVLSAKTLKEFIYDQSRVNECTTNYNAIFETLPFSNISKVRAKQIADENALEIAHLQNPSHMDTNFLQSPEKSKQPPFVVSSDSDTVSKDCITLSSSHISKGKADEPSTRHIRPIDEDNKQTVRTSSKINGIETLDSERETIDKPHCSRSADMQNDKTMQCNAEVGEILPLQSSINQLEDIPKLDNLIGRKEYVCRFADTKERDNCNTKDHFKTIRAGEGDLSVSDILTELDAGRQATSGKPPANVGSNPTQPNISQSSNNSNLTDTATSSPVILDSSSRDSTLIKVSYPRHLSSETSTSTTKRILKSDDDDNQSQPGDVTSHPVANTNTVLENKILGLVIGKPISESEIFSCCYHMGYKVPEIHKTLLGLKGTKIHKYTAHDKIMYSYIGVRATPEFDIGV